MEKNTLKKIIVESQDFLVSRKVINRDYHLEEKGNYVIVGQRRTGKTYLAFQYIQRRIEDEKLSIDQFLYINFEDERLIEFKTSDFDLLLDSYKELYNRKPVCVFDEIQIIDGWEKFIRRLADQDYRVLVTGSNSKMLSKEIATVLGGRFLLKEISGLSFREFLAFHKLELVKNYEFKDQRFEIQRLFETYLLFGSLPEIINFSNKKDYLSTLFEKIFYGDIIARYNIKNDFGFRLLVKKLAESTMDETSFNRLKNIIKSTGTNVGTQTLIEYFGYLNDSYLVHSLSNYFSKFVERETKKKFYFSDTGILGLFLIDPESSMLETFVHNHLRKRFKESLYYLRNAFEVDFYVQDQYLVQVAYSISNDQTRNREINGLINAEKKVKVKELLIITMYEDDQISINGKSIQVVPAWKWALKNE